MQKSNNYSRKKFLINPQFFQNNLATNFILKENVDLNGKIYPMSVDYGPKTDPDPEVNNTLKIIFVSKKLAGIEPLQDGDQAIIDEVQTLQKENKLTDYQKLLLDQIGRTKSLDDGYEF